MSKRQRNLFAVVLAGAALLVAALALSGSWLFRAAEAKIYPTTPLPPLAPSDAAAVARGEHLAKTLGGCRDCHGGDFGGRVMQDDGLVRVVAPNITRGRGSVVADFTAQDWARTLVHGADRHGRSLLIMPVKELRTFSDTDLSALIAYFTTAVPPVDRDLGGRQISALGRVILGLTGADIFSAAGFDHAVRDAHAPDRGLTREYGKYLANICYGCHGPELRGGIRVHPGAPPSADISPAALATWRFEQFEAALRKGKRRDGSDLDPAMPWTATRELTDEEMRALWLALSFNGADDAKPGGR